jgi:hypothetical protein
MNVAIAYRENDVLSNVNNLLFAMIHYNCLNNLLLAMIHYNCLDTEMHQLKTCQNLHMNITIAYKENDALSDVNNLFFAMTHYNCLET